MKILICCILLLGNGLWSCASPLPDPVLTTQITTILAECEKLSHGATRADLLRDFTTEGGLFSPGRRVFVSRICPYIKVEVTFNLGDSKQTAEMPGDVIKSISKPYLQYSIVD